MRLFRKREDATLIESPYTEMFIGDSGSVFDTKPSKNVFDNWKDEQSAHLNRFNRHWFIVFSDRTTKDITIVRTEWYASGEPMFLIEDNGTMHNFRNIASLIPYEATHFGKANPCQ